MDDETKSGRSVVPDGPRNEDGVEGSDVEPAFADNAGHAIADGDDHEAEVEVDPGGSDFTAEADRIEADLNGVDRELRRLTDGDYGRCRVCNAAIDDALLEASPILDVCPAHVALDSTVIS